MLEEIKKVQGICHTEFDGIINQYIQSAIEDLKAIGIANDKLTVNNETQKYDPLIYSAIFAKVLSFLDVNNSELYANSYKLQKDTLRYLKDYKEDN